MKKKKRSHERSWKLLRKNILAKLFLLLQLLLKLIFSGVMMFWYFCCCCQRQDRLTWIPTQKIFNLLHRQSRLNILLRPGYFLLLLKDCMLETRMLLADVSHRVAVGIHKRYLLLLIVEQFSRGRDETLLSQPLSVIVHETFRFSIISTLIY